MSQSTKIFAFLLFAFATYVVLRGDLPAYMEVLGLRGSTSNPLSQALYTMTHGNSGSSSLLSFGGSPSLPSSQDTFSGFDTSSLDGSLFGADASTPISAQLFGG